MKRLFAFLLALAMLLSLAACGSGSKEQDPNLGKYMGVKGEMEGLSMSMEELFPGETYLELKSGGKVDLVLEGEKATGTWKLDGENFQMTMEGEQCIGTLKNGTIVFEYADSGMFLTFQKEGGSISDKLNPQETAAVTFNDAGYWELVRMESDNPEDCVTEEQMQTLKELGMIMYLNLLPDGTGVMFMDEEMPLTWQDGTVTFTEDSMSISYTLASGELSMNLFDTVLVFRKGEQPAASAGPLGIYEGTTYEYGGQTFQMTEIYNDLCTIELLDGGKCVFTLGGEVMDCTWTLDGEEFVLINATVESPGTLKDGVITIDFMNMGMVMRFAQTSGAAGGVSDGAEEAVTETFPDAFIAEHAGDWHGMATVYEGTGAFEDEVDMEMEIIARLAFREDGTCEPYLACAFGGEDNNFKNLSAAYYVDGEEMFLFGEFVNGELVAPSKLYVLNGALYVDVYVEDAKGNTVNLYACLRRLDASWDYENDWPNLPEDAVKFYMGKSFMEIAKLFQLDLDEIPELEGEASVPAVTEAPTEAASGVSASGFGGANSYQVNEYMSKIVTTVNFTLPESMWVPKVSSETLYIYNVESLDDAYSNSPRIQFVVKQSLEKINFYIDTFENLQELESRVIGGIEMKGRSYKALGMEWIEYYAELPNGVWISVQISRTSIEPGSEGSAILDSVTFE